MVFCDPDEQFWRSEKETDLMECAHKRKGFKTVSTDDSFREYFKGSREMGTACSSIYVNYTSINQLKKKKSRWTNNWRSKPEQADSGAGREEQEAVPPLSMNTTSQDWRTSTSRRAEAGRVTVNTPLSTQAEVERFILWRELNISISGQGDIRHSWGKGIILKTGRISVVSRLNAETPPAYRPPTRLAARQEIRSPLAAKTP